MDYSPHFLSKVRWGFMFRLALGLLFLGSVTGCLVQFDSHLLTMAVLSGAVLSFLVLRRASRHVFATIGNIGVFIIFLLVAFGPLLDPGTRRNLRLQKGALGEDLQALASIVSGGRVSPPVAGFTKGFAEKVESRLATLPAEKRAGCEDTLALGLLTLRWGSPEGLVEAESLVVRFPEFPPARWALAALLFKKPDRERAFLQLDSLIALNSLNGAPLVLRAGQLMLDEKKEEAIACLVSASERPEYCSYSPTLVRGAWKDLRKARLLDLRTKAAAFYAQPSEARWREVLVGVDTAVNKAGGLARQGKKDEAKCLLLALSKLGQRMQAEKGGEGYFAGRGMEGAALKALAENGFLSKEEAELGRNRISTGVQFESNAMVTMMISRASPFQIGLLRGALALWILSLLLAVLLTLWFLLRRRGFRILLWTLFFSALGMGVFFLLTQPLIPRQEEFLWRDAPDRIARLLVPNEAFSLASDYCIGGS